MTHPSSQCGRRISIAPSEVEVGQGSLVLRLRSIVEYRGRGESVLAEVGCDELRNPVGIRRASLVIRISDELRFIVQGDTSR